MRLFDYGATLIFGLAIIHTFLTQVFSEISLKFQVKKDLSTKYHNLYHFLAELFYLFGEVEVVFGIWLIPLLGWFYATRGWGEAVEYLNTRNYTHALYIMVIVVVIGSRPLITFAERVLEWIARLGKDSPGAWWWTILTISPLLGAVLKEPGAMTLAAILLTKKFFPYKPSRNFQYATMALLFANVSIGGMLTNFSSRSLFIVAYEWEWSNLFMLKHFGWKAVLSLICINFIYYLIFRPEFTRSFPRSLPAVEAEDLERHTPLWITLLHIIFLALVVATGEHAPLFVGVFILFLGFHRATLFYQWKLHLKTAILVGFFFASLLIHGELQGWWILPLLHKLGHFSTMAFSFLLSIFVDNAIVTYLSVEVPDLTDLHRYLVVAGAMTAGGLSIIANAPNPIGLAIIRKDYMKHFSFLRFTSMALGPALLFFFLFWVLQRVPPLV